MQLLGVPCHIIRKTLPKGRLENRVKAISRLKELKYLCDIEGSDAIA